jgi:glutamine amidotransferase
MIGIVDYGSGNLRAIGNIYDRLKIDYRIINNPNDLKLVDKIILPGVGDFDQTMQMLNESGFREILDELVLGNKVPVLGICVGLQILSKGSEEGQLPGLGWINANVKKFNPDTIPVKPKLPHLGWNSIEIVKNSILLDKIDPEEGFYFIHNYFFQTNDSSDILTKTTYGIDFVSSVARENIFGVQFHPEKSHQNGILLLKNFAISKLC